jgi:hypothetical protein
MQAQSDCILFLGPSRAEIKMPARTVMSSGGQGSHPTLQVLEEFIS